MHANLEGAAPSQRFALGSMTHCSGLGRVPEEGGGGGGVETERKRSTSAISPLFKCESIKCLHLLF